MINKDYPPVSFHFNVLFKGIGDKEIDVAFQSVSGLSVSLQTENYRAGGENGFEYTLPQRARFSNLILKRGLIRDSALIKWCTDAFSQLQINPVDVDIMLLDESHKALVSWNLKRVWPVKWSVSDLNAEQDQLAIETMELSYREFTINTKPKPK